MWRGGEFRTKRCRLSSYRLAATCGDGPEALRAEARPTDDLHGSILAVDYEVIESRGGAFHRTVVTYEFDIIASESLFSSLVPRPLRLTRRSEVHGIQVNWEWRLIVRAESLHVSGERSTFGAKHGIDREILFGT